MSTTWCWIIMIAILVLLWISDRIDRFLEHREIMKQYEQRRDNHWDIRTM